MKFIFGLALMGLLIAPQSWAQAPSPAEQELVRLEHSWKQAVVNRDVSALKRLYAEEYVSTDQEGMVWNKADDIAIDTAGLFRLASYQFDDMKVRLAGNTAVVTGLLSTKGTLNGITIGSASRFTDVFVKRDGRWQCLASQATPISEW